MNNENQGPKPPLQQDRICLFHLKAWSHQHIDNQIRENPTKSRSFGAILVLQATQDLQKSDETHSIAASGIETYQLKTLVVKNEA